MERGELSYSKVRALTRIASAPTEGLLLSIALHGTAHHVETTVRCFRFRRAQQTEELSSGIAITPRTAVTRWRGERMDYGTAMDALLYRARRATLPGRVSAETRTVA